MGRKTLFVCAAAMSAAAFIGCDKADQSTGSAGGAAPTTGPSMVDSAKQMGDKAVGAAQDAAASVTAEAQKYLDQATEYVKEKKFDLADEAVKKLEALKAKLPAEWAAKIDQARSMLDTAKKAVESMPANMPAMPKMGN